MRVQLLRWEESSDHQHTLAINNNHKYDIIIASDVIACPYKEHYNDLLQTFDRLLTDDGHIYMSYQIRHYEEKVFLNAFNTLFDCEYVHNEALPKDFQYREAAMPIRLFKARRKKV